MKKSRPTLALAALAAALSAGSAAAQEAPAALAADQPDLRGFMLGLSFNGGVVGTGLPGGSRTAAGFGVTLGYGMSDALTLFTRGDYAYGSTYVDVGARYSFGGASGALRPYVEGAFTGVGALRNGARFSGTALTGGAGLEYFLTPNLALDAGMSYSRGEWERAVERGGGTAVGVSRLNLGVRWRP
jgi:opacity protein-like surface antigen